MKAFLSLLVIIFASHTAFGVSKSCEDLFRPHVHSSSSSRAEDLPNLVMQTKRLEIRVLRPHQLRETLTVWGDLQTARMSGDYISRFAAQQSLAAGRTRLTEARKGRQIYFNFGIYQNGELVGIGQIGSGQEDSIYESGKGSPNEKWASVSYHLKPSAWGKGIATEATTRLLEFAFETLNLDGLHGEAIDTNIGSIAVLGKLGFANFLNIAGRPHGVAHFYMDRLIYKAKYNPLEETLRASVGDKFRSR